MNIQDVPTRAPDRVPTEDEINDYLDGERLKLLRQAESERINARVREIRNIKMDGFDALRAAINENTDLPALQALVRYYVTELRNT